MIFTRLNMRYYKWGLFFLVFSIGILPRNLRSELPVLRIVQLCDPQLGFGLNGYDDDIARMKKAILQINELAPDLVVIAGDFVNDVNDDEAIFTFRELIAQIQTPVLLTPGNHDLPDPVTVEGLQRYHSRYGDDFKVISCKGRSIIAANSQMWREAPPEVSLQHDRLLREALQNAQKKGQPVVMVTHVPPFVEDIDEDDEYYNLPKAMREDILRLCDENGVFLWLAGHTHRTLQRRYNQITILNGETTSRNFDDHLLGFRLLTVYSEQSFDWNFFTCELEK